MRTQGARKAVGAAKLEVTEFSEGDGGNRKGLINFLFQQYTIVSVAS